MGDRGDAAERGELGLYTGELGEIDLLEAGLKTGELGLYEGDVGEYDGDVAPAVYLGDVGLYDGDDGDAKFGELGL